MPIRRQAIDRSDVPIQVSTMTKDVLEAMAAADSFEALQRSIVQHYDQLSQRLQQVADYVLAHPDDVALDTVAVIAGRARVPPSSLIRFAKASASTTSPRCSACSGPA
jgi:Helix-turn-helix domain, rpiR family